MIEESRSVRRSYSPREKLEILLEGAAVGNIAEVCRRRGITENLYYNWRSRLLANAGAVFNHGSGQAGGKREAALEERLRQKDAVIAELTQENLELKRGRCR
jgi:transposase-like protein